MNPFYRAIARRIGETSGRPFELKSVSHLGGGCINETVRLTGTDGAAWFVKSGTSPDTSVFAAEFDGLQALADTQTIRVPKPLVYGEAEGQAWFAMELLQLGGAQRDSQEQLGRQLAALHRVEQPHFGWHRDNTIGSTQQRNPRSDDWIDFWREHRLGFQLELAERGGTRFKGSDRLVDRLDDLFVDFEPRPSLLHGDLWSGNIGFLGDGAPVIFDPACYFGDREAEFGIVVMFGGFTPDFHRGYESIWPHDEGFARRLPLYELYHTLNHLNIFGTSYTAACQHLIDQLLADLDG
jgi:fructosamine-3-kinase